MFDTRRQLNDIGSKLMHHRTVEEGVLGCLLQLTITPVSFRYVFQARVEIYVIERQLGKQNHRLTEKSAAVALDQESSSSANKTGRSESSSDATFSINVR